MSIAQYLKEQTAGLTPVKNEFKRKTIEIDDDTKLVFTHKSRWTIKHDIQSPSINRRLTPYMAWHDNTNRRMYFGLEHSLESVKRAIAIKLINTFFDEADLFNWSYETNISEMINVSYGEETIISDFNELVSNVIKLFVDNPLATVSNQTVNNSWRHLLNEIRELEFPYKIFKTANSLLLGLSIRTTASSNSADTQLSQSPYNRIGYASSSDIDALRGYSGEIKTFDNVNLSLLPNKSHKSISVSGTEVFIVLKEPIEAETVQMGDAIYRINDKSKVRISPIRSLKLRFVNGSSFPDINAYSDESFNNYAHHPNVLGSNGNVCLGDLLGELLGTPENTLENFCNMMRNLNMNSAYFGSSDHSKLFYLESSEIKEYYKEYDFLTKMVNI